VPPRKSFLTRLPPELLDQVRAWAEQEMRSTNAQIEWILRDALRRHGRQKPAEKKRAKGERPPADD
jgi:hypothetical protein